MNFLSAENLSRNFGERILFEGLSFGLSKGDKVALIAKNGAGKTTLLNILAGKDHGDEGKVALRDGIRLSYLEQNPVFKGSISINELLKTGNLDVLSAIREYESTMQEQTLNYNDQTHKAFEKASSRMDELNAWDYERKVIQILTLFKIHDRKQKIDTLSGGQKKRLAIALALLDNPDIILLDEPTNHLDIDMIEWLEKYLSQSSVTILMVTHDRYFLDAVCNQILELSEGKLYRHYGKYAWYLEKKAERENISQVEIDKAGKLMKQELEWMRRMPKARTHKSKSRIDAFYTTREKALSGKMDRNLKLDVKMSRMGNKILEIKHLYKSYGDIAILRDFNYVFRKGEKIGIIGKNGVGKTSFLNMLTLQETADKGEIETGETIVYGYYSQNGIITDENKRIIDVIKDIAEIIVLNNGKTFSASQMLQYFMFTPEMQYSLVSKLSGGERRRLYLLTVLMKNPNFLILDEPTNDLDLPTLSILEDFLFNFAGCLILVSHDRYFLDRLADHLFIFEGDGEVHDFVGTYTEYSLREEKNASLENITKVSDKPLMEKSPSVENVPGKRKLSYKEKIEYERLEKEIKILESEKSELENALNSGENDYEKLETYSKRIKNFR